MKSALDPFSRIDVYFKVMPVSKVTLKADEELQKRLLKAQGTTAHAKGVLHRVNGAKQLWTGLKQSVTEWEDSLAAQIIDLKSRMESSLHQVSAETAATMPPTVDKNEDARVERHLKELIKLEGDVGELHLTLECIGEQLNKWELFGRPGIQGRLERLIELSATFQDFVARRRKISRGVSRLSRHATPRDSNPKEVSSAMSTASSAPSDASYISAPPPLTKNEKDTIIYNMDRVVEALEYVLQFPLVNPSILDVVGEVNREISAFNALLEEPAVSTSSLLHTAALRSISSTTIPSKENAPFSQSAAPSTSLINTIRVPSVKDYRSDGEGGSNASGSR
uniref:Exocyst complex component Sec8 n=1 Tax=Panagrellus redivivus TaxID=6233 RepID=A0A7E4UVS9_PANRE